jgi:hypothetical protein
MNRILLNKDKAGSGYKAHKSYGNAFLVGFLFGTGSSILQGVLHSSSLPDYIEDKKSGGQLTDRSNNTSLCNVTTNIIGREARIDRMLKTVNKSTLIGTL